MLYILLQTDETFLYGPRSFLKTISIRILRWPGFHESPYHWRPANTSPFGVSGKCFRRNSQTSCSPVKFKRHGLCWDSLSAFLVLGYSNCRLCACYIGRITFFGLYGGSMKSFYATALDAIWSALSRRSRVFKNVPALMRLVRRGILRSARIDS